MFEVDTMRITFSLFLLVSVTIVSSSETEGKGCQLVVPDEVQKQPEPRPETGPIVIHTIFNILGIRDVPASGGHFGVDLMKV